MSAEQDTSEQNTSGQAKSGRITGEPTLPGSRAYTIGNTPQYERWRDTVLYKDVGGSVWPDLMSVLAYFVSIRGAVRLVGGQWSGAGVYAVEMDASWDACTEPVEGQIWASLTTPARVVGTVCTHVNEAARLMGRAARGQMQRERAGVFGAGALTRQARSGEARSGENTEEAEMSQKSAPKQVIVLRKDLDMPVGEAAAQAAHAALSAFLAPSVIGSVNDTGSHRGSGQLQMKLREVDAEWIRGSQAKIVLGIDGEAALRALFEMAKARGLRSIIITNEDRTVFGEPTTCALAIGPERPEDVDSLTRHLKRYRTRA